ncbi:MAG: glycerophosphodiester phosphodiesterase [Actinomycetota bacterium]|nr:glycerophosphodiester phosphodiesterase [Actinomycetota bacterium]
MFRNGAGRSHNVLSPSETVVNIAHRGASAYAPEHTVASYDLALELGADYIEQDLHMTADGMLVVLHDATLERTAWGTGSRARGAVASKTWAELRVCDVGSWFNLAFPYYARPEYEGMRILSLDQTLDRYGSTTRYYIETKTPDLYPGMEEELLRVLKQHDLTTPGLYPWRVIVQSFSVGSLEKMHALDPSLPLIQLTLDDGASIQNTLEAVASYAVGIGVRTAVVSPGLIEDAHRHGLLVHAFTAFEYPEMTGLVELGVDGVFTDYPDRLDDVLGFGSGPVGRKEMHRSS